MSLRCLTHTGLCVSDLERSVAFYRDVLGFEELGRLAPDAETTSHLLGIPDVDLRAVYLENDGWRLELLHYESPGHVGSSEARPMNGLGLTHLSFRVDDLDEVIQKLEKAGGRVLEQNVVKIRGGQFRALFALDPDGTRLELIDVPGDPRAMPGS
ncbi:VOC family protein [Myxococcota bacterium]|nr:VOC family protein [Myxococcota bacterium]